LCDVTLNTKYVTEWFFDASAQSYFGSKVYMKDQALDPSTLVEGAFMPFFSEIKIKYTNNKCFNKL
jgi:hypothetical protein